MDTGATLAVVKRDTAKSSPNRYTGVFSSSL